MPFVELEPLDLEQAEDRAFMSDFMRKYFAEMDKLNIAKNLRELATGQFGTCLFQASGGVVGVALKLVETAVSTMIAENRVTLSYADFAAAHDHLRLTEKLYTKNAFWALLNKDRAFA